MCFNCSASQRPIQISPWENKLERVESNTGGKEVRYVSVCIYGFFHSSTSIVDDERCRGVCVFETKTEECETPRSPRSELVCRRTLDINLKSDS